MSAPERKAPERGYAFAEKSKYRDAVWRAFADAWGEQLADQRALILPSKEGMEIPVALRWGASERNLIGIDENPAVIATAKWRDAYPRVWAMGSSLGRSAERVAEEGVKVGVANLDLCNKFSRPLLEELRRFAAADILADTAVVAVTLHKGREHPETVAALQMLAERCGMNWNSDPGRPFFAMLFMSEAAKGRAWRPVASGEYRSGSKNMVYMVAMTATVEAMRREHELLRDYVAPFPKDSLEAFACEGLRQHQEWEKSRYWHRSSFHVGYLRGRGDWWSHCDGWNYDHGNFGTPFNDWDPLHHILRELFPDSPVAADEYITGMLDWAHDQWKRQADAILREWRESTRVKLPWCDRWRGAPQWNRPDAVIGGLTGHYGYGYAPETSPTTAPFNLWAVNRCEGKSAEVAA